MKDLHDTEERVTDAATGGQKGFKLTQLGSLDPVALIELARVAGMGAKKYAPYNFMRGFDWSLAYNAMMRHALLFWSGEETDPESGLNHMAHAAWMALCLVSFSERKLGKDDRYVDPDPVMSIDQVNAFLASQAAGPVLATTPVQTIENGPRLFDPVTTGLRRCPAWAGSLRCHLPDWHVGPHEWSGVPADV